MFVVISFKHNKLSFRCGIFMQGNLSLIFSSKLTVGIELNSRETVRFSQNISVQVT